MQVKIAEGYQDFNVSLVTIFLIKHQQVMSTFLRSLDWTAEVIQKFYHSLPFTEFQESGDNNY